MLKCDYYTCEYDADYNITFKVQNRTLNYCKVHAGYVVMLNELEDNPVQTLERIHKERKNKCLKCEYGALFIVYVKNEDGEKIDYKLCKRHMHDLISETSPARTFFTMETIND